MAPLGWAEGVSVAMATLGWFEGVRLGRPNMHPGGPLWTPWPPMRGSALVRRAPSLPGEEGAFCIFRDYFACFLY